MSTTEPLKPGTIQFVTDGPPAHKSGRFVELEDHTGASIGMGRWEDRGNGLWALIVEPAEAAALKAEALREAAEDFTSPIDPTCYLTTEGRKFIRARADQIEGAAE